MTFFKKIEKKFGKYAIHNLMLYIIIANAITFFFNLFKGGNLLLANLTLVPELVLKGQVWRLFTFIFLPPTDSVLFLIFALYFYYLIGNALETKWGAFKFNLYYFIGMLSLIIGSFITNIPATNFYLNLSLFLVFAHLFPTLEVALYFIIPIKIKYLAVVYWILIAVLIIQASSFGEVLMVIMPLLNFFLFCGKDIIKGFSRRRKKAKFKIDSKPEKFSVKDNLPKNYSVHKCTICGITENVDRNMEFRFCSKCNGFHEYCMPHLKEHEHIKEEPK